MPLNFTLLSEGVNICHLLSHNVKCNNKIKSISSLEEVKLSPKLTDSLVYFTVSPFC